MDTEAKEIRVDLFSGDVMRHTVERKADLRDAPAVVSDEAFAVLRECIFFNAPPLTTIK